MPVSLRPGQATEAGTARLARRALSKRHVDAAHFRPTPGGLTLSSLGLGTYIGAPDAITDSAVEQAVTLSVGSGRVNVIDTALNYRHQRAERSIGRALSRIIEGGKVARDELFIATKNGYLAPDGESALSPRDWVQKELLGPGVLRREDLVEGSHAMSVPFLRDQLERSRRNLGVACIDLLYLHNAPDAQLPVVGREEFLARLSAAFEFLEEARSRGEVGAYGIATWDSLRAPPTDPSFLDLESALGVAVGVGGEDHGFRFVQFPFSLALPEAATVCNQPVRGERLDVFSACRRLGLAPFTSVPLHQGALARSGPTADGLSRAQTAVQFARSAPGSQGPLVGQKRPEHLSENLRLAEIGPWSEAEFHALLP